MGGITKINNQNLVPYKFFVIKESRIEIIKQLKRK